MEEKLKWNVRIRMTNISRVQFGTDRRGDLFDLVIITGMSETFLP